MMLVPCPWCGPRNVAEFRYVGESTPRPDPATASASDWRTYLYTRRNPWGWIKETWYHRMGCRQYFALERHTHTHQIRSAEGTR